RRAHIVGREHGDRRIDHTISKPRRLRTRRESASRDFHRLVDLALVAERRVSSSDRDTRCLRGQRTRRNRHAGWLIDAIAAENEAGGDSTRETANRPWIDHCLPRGRSLFVGTPY